MSRSRRGHCGDDRPLTLTRTEPPRTNPELAALNSWLGYNRATLLSKLDGLTEEQAGQPIVGSDTTLHGSSGT